jgi:hypothetical protein
MKYHAPRWPQLGFADFAARYPHRLTGMLPLSLDGAGLEGMATRKDTIIFDRSFFAESGRKGWDKLSPKKRKERIAKQTGYWKSMTAAQRKVEMKRRAKVRAANKLEKSKPKPETAKQ